MVFQDRSFSLHGTVVIVLQDNVYVCGLQIFFLQAPSLWVLVEYSHAMHTDFLQHVFVLVHNWLYYPRLP